MAKYPLHKKITPLDYDELPTIRYRGEFDWPGLYNLIRKIYKEEEYDLTEKKYKDKGDEVEIEINGSKKIDAMHKYYFDTSIHVWDLKQTEKEQEGKKIKTYTGKIEIKLNIGIERDYQNKFTGKIGEKVGEAWAWLTQKEFEINHADALTYWVLGIQTRIKEFLNMSTAYTNY